MSIVLGVDIRGIEQINLAIAKLPEKKTKQLSGMIYDNLVEATPVDTGTARESWDIARSEQGIKDTKYGEYGYPKRPSIPDSTSLVVGSRNTWMKYLDRGYSPQAPTYFVTGAVQRAIHELYLGL